MAKIENPMAVVQSGGGGDPDLAVFDYSKFSGVYGPTSYYFTNNCTQKKIKVIFPDTYSGACPLFANATNQLEEVEIQTNGTITSIGGIIYQSYVKHLTLNFSTANIPASGWGIYTFRYAGYGTGNSCRIDGQPIDLSGVESGAKVLCSSAMFYQSHINYVRFKPNTLNMSGTAKLDGAGTEWDDDSLASLCNVLGETTVGTVSFADGHNNTKRRLPTLMGYVDTSRGFNLFVKDSSGTLSLEEFIAVTKGWTIA